MIVYEGPGDVLSPYNGCQTLVVPVNTVGVMGNGLAKAFAVRFPDLKRAYQKACKDGVFEKEYLFCYDLPDGRKALCFPTKYHWTQDSDLDLIQDALDSFVNGFAQRNGITSVAMPLIGCGKGNLDWMSQVRPLVFASLSDCPVNISIFYPTF